MKNLIVLLIAIFVFAFSAFSNSLSKKDRDKLLSKAAKYDEKGKYDKASECWIQLLNDEPFFAGFFLGRYYDYGLGMPRDIDKAIYYYEFSAKAGDFESQYRLGELLFDQDSIKRDDKKAFHWNMIAATNPLGANSKFERDISISMYNLARCFKDGIGIKKNQDLYDIWLALSAYLDLRGAQEEVSERYAINIDQDTPEQEEALSYTLLEHFCGLILKHIGNESDIEFLTIRMASNITSQDTNAVLQRYKYIEQIFNSDSVPIKVQLDFGEALLMYYRDFKYDLYKVEQMEKFLEDHKNIDEGRGKWYVKQYIKAATYVTNKLTDQ